MSKRNREKRTFVKGNTAKYSAEKPLFGKYVGSVYRSEHERGISEQATAIETIQSPNNPVETLKNDNAQRIFTSNGCLRDNEIICPYCGDNYVHFLDPKYFSGDDNYEARGIYDMGVRGDVITIDFWCEDGHEWTLVLGEHKGQVFHKIAKTETQQKQERNGDTVMEQQRMTITKIDDWKFPQITLELRPEEARMLMGAITLRQLQISKIVPGGVPEEYAELESIYGQLYGQIKMLEAIKEDKKSEQEK